MKKEKENNLKNKGWEIGDTDLFLDSDTTVNAMPLVDLIEEFIDAKIDYSKYPSTESHLEFSTRKEELADYLGKIIK